MSGLAISSFRLPPWLPRRRLPFLPLVVFGAAGILLAGHTPLNSQVWLTAGGLSFLVFFLRRDGSVFFYLGIVSLMACLQLWNTRESPAARLASWLGEKRLVAKMHGTVADMPQVFGGGRAAFDLFAGSMEFGGTAHSLALPLSAEWLGPVPEYGDRTVLFGSLENIPPPRNPGEFDEAKWSALHGIYSRISVSAENDARILPGSRGNPLVALALKARAWMKDTLTRGIAGDTLASGLILAMTIGETSSLPAGVREEFRGTGTYHLFSVSGLHVGMLGLILWSVLRVACVPRRAAALAIIPALFFYVLMTGLGPASLRSAIMAAIVLAGFLTDRPPQLFNNLLAAAFLILVLDTRQIFHPGFQLSFTVVAAILLLAGPIQARCEAWFRPDPFIPRRLPGKGGILRTACAKKFAGLLAVSLAAWAGSLPLTLGYFHLVSWSALPANLVAVPLSFGIMAVAMLSAASGLLFSTLPAIFNQTAWLLAKILIFTVQAFAALPGSFTYVGTPDWPGAPARLTVLDFGNGAACEVSAAGRNWLIDCGPAYKYNSVLAPFLRSRGAVSPDGLILTHGDAEHIGAAARLLEPRPPSFVMESAADDRSPIRNRFHRLLAEREIPKRLLRAGDMQTLSRNAGIEVLYPPPGISRGTADDKALVLRLKIEKARVLLLSDAGLAAEQWLLKNAPRQLACDVMVIGVPDSSPTIGPELLDAAKPRLVVAACGLEHDDKKLPAPLVQAIKSRNIALFRQDECGAVTIRITPDSLGAESFIGRRKFFHPLP